MATTCQLSRLLQTSPHQISGLPIKQRGPLPITLITIPLPAKGERQHESHASKFAAQQRSNSPGRGGTTLGLASSRSLSPRVISAWSIAGRSDTLRLLYLQCPPTLSTQNMALDVVARSQAHQRQLGTSPASRHGGGGNGGHHVDIIVQAGKVRAHRTLALRPCARSDAHHHCVSAHLHIPGWRGPAKCAVTHSAV
jgi:hypothetical protein